MGKHANITGKPAQRAAEKSARTASNRWRNRIVGYGNEDPRTLKANDANWRLHPAAQAAAMDGALDAIGWIQDIIVNLRRASAWGAARGVKTTLDGHLRVDRAIFYNEPTVPVKYVDLTPNEELTALATFDPLSAMAQTDGAKLQDALARIAVEDAGLKELTAQLEQQAQAAIRAASGEIKETTDVGALVDRAAELQKKWQVKRGDVWEIPSLTARGKCHRIMCGDSTSAEDVGRLMGEKNAQVIVTDPPYKLDYSGGGFSMAEIDSNFKERLKPLTNFDPSQLFNVLESLDFGCAFIWTNKELLPEYFEWIKTKRFMFNLFVWCKDNPPPFTSATFLPDVEYCVWIAKKSRRWTKGLEYKDYSKWYQSGIHQGKREGKDLHPTIKPLEFIQRMVVVNCEAGSIALDLYVGSGTTLVACEQTGRIGRGMEIEPKYVAVALERLSLLGLEPRRVTDSNPVPPVSRRVSRKHSRTRGA